VLPGEIAFDDKASLEFEATYLGKRTRVEVFARIVFGGGGHATISSQGERRSSRIITGKPGIARNPTSFVTNSEQPLGITHC
jgi:hypothetical protein